MTSFLIDIILIIEFRNIVVELNSNEMINL